MDVPALCGGALILACIIIIVYMLTRKSAPFSCGRAICGADTVVRVRANQDLRRVEVRRGGKDGAVTFVREGVKAGQEVEFAFPAFSGKIMISAHDGKEVHNVDV